MKQEKVNLLIDENIEQIHKLIQEKINIWSEYVLFSGLWWLGVGLSVIPWIIWFIVRKKESTDRILYAGFFVMEIHLFNPYSGSNLFSSSLFIKKRQIFTIL